MELAVLKQDLYSKHGYIRVNTVKRKPLNVVGFTGSKYNTSIYVRFNNKKVQVRHIVPFGHCVIEDSNQ